MPPVVEEMLTTLTLFPEHINPHNITNVYDMCWTTTDNYETLLLTVETKFFNYNTFMYELKAGFNSAVGQQKYLKELEHGKVDTNQLNDLVKEGKLGILEVANGPYAYHWEAEFRKLYKKPKY